MTEQMNLYSTDDPHPRLRLEKARAAGRHAPIPQLPRNPLSGGQSGHLIDYVRVLHKRRWTALTAFLLIVGTVTVRTFTAVPIYEASARLLIESDERNVVSFKRVIEEDQTKQDYYQTQYNILQSRALARRTLQELRLWDTPPYGGASAPAFSVSAAVSGLPSAVARWFRKSEPVVQESAAAGTSETAAQSRAIDAFLGSVSIAPVRNSRLVDVRFRSADAGLAAKIVNALAKAYIEQNFEYKFTASKEAGDWLGARLSEQRKEVEAAETRLQQYREQNDAIAMEDRQNIVVQKLADINAAVTRASTERIQKEALHRQLQRSQADPTRLDTFPAILTNSFIQQLKGELAELQRQHGQLSEKLGDRHPEIIKLKRSIQISQAKLNGEIGKVVQSVRSEYQTALAQQTSLTAALDQQKNEALSMNRKAIDYGVLERDMESTKQIYDSLMQRAKETSVAGELKTNNIRVIDPAESPRMPVSPQKRKAVMQALLTGMFAACGLVFFFEYMDSRIKTPEEVRQYLGLSHLGLLPSIAPKEIAGSYPLIHHGVSPGFVESLRAVRTNILFSSAEEGMRSLLITSTGSGEGKSMLAANLAISLAQAGQRVLLIDADMRKPKAHVLFDLAQEPGLSNLLVGNAKTSEAVRKTPITGLWVVAAGRVPPNPAELLGSQRFSDFFATLKGHFDWVLVDSPPVMAVTDATVLSRVIGGVVFVIGAEMTSRHAAQRAIDQLHQASATLVGAVLNRVDLRHNAYYYSAYYRNEYAQYYQQPTSKRSA